MVRSRTSNGAGEVNSVIHNLRAPHYSRGNIATAVNMEAAHVFWRKSKSCLLVRSTTVQPSYMLFVARSCSSGVNRGIEDQVPIREW